MKAVAVAVFLVTTLVWIIWVRAWHTLMEEWRKSDPRRPQSPGAWVRSLMDGV